MNSGLLRPHNFGWLKYFALLVVYYSYFRNRGDSSLPDNVLWRTESIRENISGIRGRSI